VNPVNVLMWHATFSESRPEVMIFAYLKEFSHRIVIFDWRILIAYTLPDVTHLNIISLTKGEV